MAFRRYEDKHLCIYHLKHICRCWGLSGGCMGSRPYRILSFDGGGFLGLYGATMISNIQEEFFPRENVHDHFDLIAGTSTGGIIALGLAAGLSPQTLVEFYDTHGPAIFGRRSRKGLFGLFSTKYSNSYLKDILDQCLGDRLMRDAKTAVLVPAINMSTSKEVVFKAHTNKKKPIARRKKYRMADVALATSAAPTYFPKHQFSDYHGLIDGGLWQNNPSLLAVFEALCHSVGPGKEYDEISLLSIGNPLSAQGSRRSLDSPRSSILHWNNDLILQPMKISSNSVHDMMVQAVKHQVWNLEKYVRICSHNPSGSVRHLKMDRAGERHKKIIREYAAKDFYEAFESLTEFFPEEDHPPE